MRTVKILSGVSGSGKSHHAEQLKAEAGGEAAICSADFYFERDGGYAFDPSKLGEAHTECFRAFLSYLQEGRPLVIVSNTNVSTADISPYMLAASVYGYDAEVITLVNDPNICLARNKHGVSEHVLKRQLERLERRRLPSGWKRREIRSGQ